MSWKNQGHVFDEVGYLLKDKKNLYIYGVGDYTAELVRVIDYIKGWTKWNVCMVDRDVNKQKEQPYGYPVISPEEFFNAKKEDYFIVIGTFGNGADEIHGIIDENLGENALTFYAFDFIHTYLSVYFLYKHNMVFFAAQNMLPSTVCNLNCRDCLNFTPYIQQHHIETVEQLKKDANLFFNAVDLVYRFNLSGGEPLLYKNLIEVIQYIGENYRDRIIQFELVTNGTLVPSDELCEVLDKYKIQVTLDDYRKSIEHEQYEKCLQKLRKYNNIEVVENCVDKWFRMYIPEIDENRRETKEELICKYNSCKVPFSALWHGKISSCTYMTFAYKAGLCEWDETASYDLENYDETKKKELVEFRLRQCENGYVEFCKKCGGWCTIVDDDRLCCPAIQMKKPE
jgi:organic radical activating enzyme